MPFIVFSFFLCCCWIFWFVSVPCIDSEWPGKKFVVAVTFFSLFTCVCVRVCDVNMGAWKHDQVELKCSLSFFRLIRWWELLLASTRCIGEVIGVHRDSAYSSPLFSYMYLFVYLCVERMSTNTKKKKNFNTFEVVLTRWQTTTTKTKTSSSSSQRLLGYMKQKVTRERKLCRRLFLSLQFSQSLIIIDGKVRLPALVYC